MVQVIQPDSQGAMFGRGFGQGLADTLPKEIERGRLSAGLKNIGENKGNLNPYQQASELLSIPGMTPEKVAILQPLLERQNANRDAQRLAGNGVQQPPNGQPQSKQAPQQQSSNPEGQQQSQAQPQPNESLIKSGPQQAALNPIPPLTTQEARTRGAELHQQYPSKFKTTTEGEEEAVRERQSEIDQQNNLINQGAAQSGLRAELEKEIDKRLTQDLQKEGNSKWKDVNGAYIKKVTDREDINVANGKKTTQQAAEDASKDIADFARLRMANQTEGAKWMLSKNANSTRSMINAQRKGYEKRGELNTLVDDLISNHGMTREGAESLTYPTQENSKLNSWINSQPKLPFAAKFSNTKAGGLKQSQERGRKLAHELPKYLSDKDSIASVVTSLANRDIDTGAMIDELRRMRDTDEIALTKHNYDLLDKLGTYTPSLGDYFLFTFGDYDYLPKDL